MSLCLCVPCLCRLRLRLCPRLLNRLHTHGVSECVSNANARIGGVGCVDCVGVVHRVVSTVQVRLGYPDWLTVDETLAEANFNPIATDTVTYYFAVCTFISFLFIFSYAYRGEREV
jgi:hypothetical protein